MAVNGSFSRGLTTVTPFQAPIWALALCYRLVNI